MSTNDLEVETGADARKTYFAQTRSWSQDLGEEIARSRRTAWLVAAAAVGVAVLEALALLALLPLRQVVPYTLLVDRNTGFAQELQGGEVPRISAESALNQSLLAQYVIARETFDLETVQDQYRKTALWSADAARRDYLSLMAQSNPQSPVNLNRRTTKIATHVESVTQSRPGQALVRFYTERRDGEQVNAPRDYWISLINYRFSGEPLAIEDRLVNPLGFQVVGYRRDQEAPPVPDTDARSAPAPSAPASPAPASSDPSASGAARGAANRAAR